MKVESLIMAEEKEKRGSKGTSSGWYVGSRYSWPPLLPSPEGALGNTSYFRREFILVCKQGDILLCGFISAQLYVRCSVISVLSDSLRPHGL